MRNRGLEDSRVAYCVQGRDTAMYFGAGASTTRYYLSKDPAKGAGDILLSGARQLGVLPPFKFSTGTVAVTVPAGTAPGAYYLLACADDLGAVKQYDETNNCLSTASPITVTP